MSDFMDVLGSLFFIVVVVLIGVFIVMAGCQSYRRGEAEIDYLKRKNHNLNIEIKEGR